MCQVLRFIKGVLTDPTFDGPFYQYWFIDSTEFVAIMGFWMISIQKIFCWYSIVCQADNKW